MDQWIEAYADGWRKIKEAVDGLTEEQLLFRPDEKSWSIKQVVVHLADTEIVALERMKRTIAEPEPGIQAFDQDAWAIRLDYQSADLELHLTLFKCLRESFVPVLRKLTPEDWARKGVHNVNGASALSDMLKMYVKHVDNHLRQIDRIKAAYAARSS
jgi:hypothetical protein